MSDTKPFEERQPQPVILTAADMLKGELAKDQMAFMRMKKRGESKAALQEKASTPGKQSQSENEKEPED